MLHWPDPHSRPALVRQGQCHRQQRQAHAEVEASRAAIPVPGRDQGREPASTSSEAKERQRVGPAQQENQAPVWWLEHEDQAGPTCDIAGRPRAARDVLARGTRAGTGTRQRAGTARQTEAGRRGDRGRVGGRGQYVQQTHARRHACSEDA